MTEPRATKATPWVVRLLALNGAVLLLLTTVFTAPRFVDALTFDPARFTQRPWTALTYLVVHTDLIHLALVSLLLYLFGPPVERRLGSRRFIAYYLYCGIGAALGALAVSAILRVDPFVGASGSVYGVGLAFVLFWPTAQVQVFPLPVAATARNLFLSLLAIDIVLGIWGQDGIAHFAHLGGALAGYVFFRLQSLTTRRQPARAVPVRRPVVTPMRVQETVTELRPAAPVGDRMPEISDQEVDQLLDKISQFGLSSLTSQERRFLSEAAERKRRDRNE